MLSYHNTFCFFYGFNFSVVFSNSVYIKDDRNFEIGLTNPKLIVIRQVRGGGTNRLVDRHMECGMRGIEPGKPWLEAEVLPARL